MASQSATSSTLFNKEDIEKLRHFLGSLETPISSCSLACSCKFPKSSALNVSESCPLNSEIWIIDSGATNHMTNNASQFNTYTPSPGNRKIKVVYGTLAIVAGYGTIYLTPSLILKNVLHVPKLSGECGGKDSGKYIFESLDLESEPNSTIEPVVKLVEPESVSAGNENETTTQPL
ncbi:hypothetical protein LWI29_005730 [Acer saccharum]|uniref:Retrovirus-related Pol polyprotein from transposon TNT 1-94-like beta-barrel domain-containing protein n=1 Tax=Acer saccharum TaxID=4024 RepID=A0AA39VFC6_ACESA|nr:hypothetical protein LWI29_005730 [Acer saccharum]